MRGHQRIPRAHRGRALVVGGGRPDQLPPARRHGLAPPAGTAGGCAPVPRTRGPRGAAARSEEHTSELQSRGHLVCRLLLEKKKKKKNRHKLSTTKKKINN